MPAPIDRVLPPLPKLAPQDLERLNEALQVAIESRETAREAEAQLQIMRIAADRLERAFISLRSAVSVAIGVRLGETHGWDALSGEVLEVPQRPVQR